MSDFVIDIKGRKLTSMFLCHKIKIVINDLKKTSKTLKLNLMCQLDTNVLACSANYLSSRGITPSKINEHKQNYEKQAEDHQNV